MRQAKATAASQPYPPQKTFLTNEQFCQLVGRSHHTSQRWRTQGEGPPFLKVGGRIMYDLEDDVLPWLEAQKRTNTGYDEQGEVSK